MLVSCWSAKGGSGATVVAVALATVLAGRNPDGALLVDAAGDLPLALGLPTGSGPGVSDWLAAGPEVPADALGRLEVPVRPGLRLLPLGRRRLTRPDRAEVLSAVLAGEARHVVVDVGVVASHPDDDPHAEVGRVLATHGTRSLLVTRACYLALARARALPWRGSGAVLVREPGRALGRREVEDMLGVPVVAEVPLVAEVSRAADSGALRRTLPRSLERAVRRAA